PRGVPQRPPGRAQDRARVRRDAGQTGRRDALDPRAALPGADRHIAPRRSRRVARRPARACGVMPSARTHGAGGRRRPRPGPRGRPYPWSQQKTGEKSGLEPDREQQARSAGGETGHDLERVIAVRIEGLESGARAEADAERRVNRLDRPLFPGPRGRGGESVEGLPAGRSLDPPREAIAPVAVPDLDHQNLGVVPLRIEIAVLSLLVDRAVTPLE